MALKSFFSRGDPDSDLDLATSYPNSKFIAILPSNLIEAVQVELDPLFRLAEKSFDLEDAPLFHHLMNWF